MQGDTIESIHDLADFVGRLASDIESGRVRLSNTSVAGFLEALSGCLADADGRYLNLQRSRQDIGPFQQFADALDAATVYD